MLEPLLKYLGAICSNKSQRLNNPMNNHELKNLSKVVKKIVKYKPKQAPKKPEKQPSKAELEQVYKFYGKRIVEIEG